MKDVSMLQLFVGTVSITFLIIAATFAGYWNLIGKKHRSLSKQEIPRAINSNRPQAGTGFQQ